MNGRAGVWVGAQFHATMKPAEVLDVVIVPNVPDPAKPQPDPEPSREKEDMP